MFCLPCVEVACGWDLLPCYALKTCCSNSALFFFLFHWTSLLSSHNHVWHFYHLLFSFHPVLSRVLLTVIIGGSLQVQLCYPVGTLRVAHCCLRPIFSMVSVHRKKPWPMYALSWFGFCRHSFLWQFTHSLQRCFTHTCTPQINSVLLQNILSDRNFPHTHFIFLQASFACERNYKDNKWK